MHQGRVVQKADSVIRRIVFLNLCQILPKNVGTYDSAIVINAPVFSL